MNKYFSLLLFSIILFPITLNGQIVGRVIDSEGASIPGSFVSALTPDSVRINTVVSKSDGTFELSMSSIAYPVVKLHVSHAGFTPTTIQVNNQTKLDVGNIVLLDRLMAEVIIVRERMIVKDDAHLFYPTIEEIKHSQSGYDLLQKIGIPQLGVDIVSKSIKLMGGSGAGSDVEVYINDRKASREDIVAVLPDEVMRVEYIDNPSARYGSMAGAAVNFVVKRSYSGYVLGLNTTNAITTRKGNNFLNARFNYKSSEWSVRYSNDYGKMKNRLIDQEDSYLIDGDYKTITRRGIKTRLAYNLHNISLVYDFSIPKEWNVRAELSGSFYDSPDRGHKQIITEPNKSDYYSMTGPREKNHVPSLNIFVKRNISDKNVLMANLVGTYIDTKYGYSFGTYEDEALTRPINKYGYTTEGKRYSGIAEIRDQHTFRNKTTLSTGAKYTLGRVDNRYLDNNDNVTENKIDDQRAYLYSNLWFSLSPQVRGMFGLAWEYLQFNQVSSVNTFSNLRPTLQLQYSPTNSIKAVYFGTIYTAYTGLSQLSDVQQMVNEWEIRKGNPNLKPYKQYTQSLTLSYNHKRYFVQNQLFASIYDKPFITQSDAIKDDAGNTRYLFHNENIKSGLNFFNTLNARVEIVPKKLSLSSSITYQLYQLNLEKHRHKADKWFGYFQLNYYNNNFSAGATYSTRNKNFDSFMEYYNSSALSVFAEYKYKKCSFGLSVSNLFSKEYQSGERWSHPQVHKDLKVRIPAWANMVSISFSWNFSKGRSYKSTNPSLWNSDSDTGILKM